MKLPLGLQQKLDEREHSGHLRALRVHPALTDFYSNDYLGLARSPLFRERLDAALVAHKDTRIGSTGSRLLSGTDQLTLELEQQLAKFHGTEAALLFNSGYVANTGFFSALPQRGDTIFYDEASHASIKDGIRLSFAKAYAFRHNDLEDLRRKGKHASGQVYVAVESLYSMDGDYAPLTELATLCQEIGALLVVDEAHSNGLFGTTGAGLVAALGLEKLVFARIVTFGKALGSHGAAVLGHSSLTQYLLNFSRPFIYTTALPPHSVLAIKVAYDLLPSLSAQRTSVHSHAAFLTERLSQTNHRYNPDNSPIQSIFINNPHRLREVGGQLEEAGFLVRPILSPTVPQGQERLRLIVHAFNTQTEIETLLQTIDQAL